MVQHRRFRGRDGQRVNLKGQPDFRLQHSVLLLFVLFSPAGLLQQSFCSMDPYDLVSPRIGTAYDGQTYPVVGLPFGVTGWTPETQATENKCL